MKILRVIASMDPRTGGPCEGIRNSVPAMSEEGFFNEVACLDDPESEYLGKDPFPIHALGPARNPWRYSPRFMTWMKKNLSRFDAVVVHGLWLYPSHAVRKSLLSSDGQALNIAKPWYVMPHGMLDPYFQKAPERRLKAMRNELYWKLIESKVIASAHGVLFTCEEEKILARTAFTPYKPQAEYNVGYGIHEPPAFKPEFKQAFHSKCQIGSNDPYILFLSRIHPKKGLDLLLNAYADVVAVGGEAVVPQLVVVGPGLDTTFGKELLKRVQSDQHIKTRVHFTGMLRHEAKWGAFYGCEAFILPSHQENFGISIVEAMACSKPVLITDKVNIWREILHDRAGIVKPNTAEGIKALLSEWLISASEEQKEMGKLAYTSFTRRYTIKAHVQNLIKVLTKDFATR